MSVDRATAAHVRRASAVRVAAMAAVAESQLGHKVAGTIFFDHRGIDHIARRPAFAEPASVPAFDLGLLNLAGTLAAAAFTDAPVNTNGDGRSVLTEYSAVTFGPVLKLHDLGKTRPCRIEERG